MEHVISNSPHVKSGNTTRKIMLDVVIALLPAAIVGMAFFGWSAVLVVLLSVLSAVLSEFVFLLCMKKKITEILKTFDCSSVVTGLLLAMTFPPSVAWYIPVLSAIFAVIVVKMLFGGTGKNLVNPALTGRVFAFISFQAAMTSGWTVPLSHDVTAGATVLTDLLQNGLKDLSLWDLFLGVNLAGCIGETCKLALIVGGLYLIIRGVLDFRWPLVYLAATGLFTVALNGFNFAYFLPSILTGGVMLGAIFMATDYTTTPNTKVGNYVYFIVLGILTAGLRQATGIEVVSFAILLMNLTVPLIDKWIYPRPFGSHRAKKENKQ